MHPLRIAVFLDYLEAYDEIKRRGLGKWEEDDARADPGGGPASFVISSTPKWVHRFETPAPPELFVWLGLLYCAKLLGNPIAGWVWSENDKCRTGEEKRQIGGVERVPGVSSCSELLLLPQVRRCELGGLERRVSLKQKDWFDRLLYGLAKFVERPWVGKLLGVLSWIGLIIAVGGLVATVVSSKYFK